MPTTKKFIRLVASSPSVTAIAFLVDEGDWFWVYNRLREGEKITVETVGIPEK